MTTPGRYTAKGKWITSNYGVTQLTETTYRCDGCRRVFSMYDMHQPARGLWPEDRERFIRLNVARAQRHADRCKGG